jgi:catechol 2,3-dioxygenase
MTMLAATPDLPALEAFDAPMHIGFVALNVRDPARMTAFYRDAMGLDLLRQDGPLTQLGKDGEVLVNLHHEPEATMPAPRAPGLFHTAFLVPSRTALGRWLAHAAASGVRLDGASDHIVSEALYLSDPEGNGIEIYVDRPRAQWVHQDGQILMDTLPLNLQALLDEAAQDRSAWEGLAPGSRIGHIHLKASDSAAAEAFYADVLGFTPTYRRQGASWLGAGGYHHHVAANQWSSRGGMPGDGTTFGLRAFGITVADAASWNEIANRHGRTVSGAISLSDPSGNRIEIRRG